jgi:hypothetical protein
MHLSSPMPYVLCYRHIYPNALLARAVTYTYNLIHSPCPYSRDPIPTFLGPYPRRERSSQMASIPSLGQNQ